MICPRCTIGEVSDDTGLCALCGFQPGVGVAVHRPVVDEVLETVQRELEGQFRINALLRHGTRSVVYVADELPSKRLVALKVIPLQRGMNPDLARFEREATLSASLSHSHIAQVLEFGRTEALLWYSMVYVKGHSLADLLRDSGPLELDACQKILEQVASALDYMHRRGVTHRNLKPSNILVDREDWARVSDPCVMDALAAPGNRSRSVGGSPEYIAPEQFRARSAGPSVDQYALGVIAYECLSRNLPFVGDAPDEMEQLHRGAVPAPLGQLRPDLPPHVCDAVNRALSKTPGQRFPTVLDFAAMLRKDWVVATAEPLMPDGTPSSQSRVFVVDGNRGRLPIVRVALMSLVVLAIVISSVWFKPWQMVLGSQSMSTPIPPPAANRILDRPAARVETAQSVEATTNEAEPTTALPLPEPTRQAPVTPQVPIQQTRSELPPVEPGKLIINATPWGQIYIDGELMGNTPKSLTLPAGTHNLRVVRDGFVPFEREIQLGPGQQIRLTDIVLRARQL